MKQPLQVAVWAEPALRVQMEDNDRRPQWLYCWPGGSL